MSGEGSKPDFYLIEGDTFWHDLGVDRVACLIVEGPRNLIRGYPVKQWLVRVAPPVTDKGVVTNVVLVDSHRPDVKEPGYWALFNTGTYSLHPQAVQGADGSFDIGSTLGGHKMSAITDPDRFRHAR